jgi:predicted PurR-regulated permease PerM
MGKAHSVSITTGTIITTLCVLAGVYVLWLLRDLVLLMLTAIVIASAIEPGVMFFIKWRIPRILSVLLVYVLVFGSLLVLLYLFLPLIIGDAAGFFATLPQYFNVGDISNSVSTLKDVTGFLGSGEMGSFVQSLLSLESAFLENTGNVLQVFATFFGGVVSLGLVIVLSFYFALQDTGVDDFLRLVLPVTYEDYSVDLWKRSQKKIGLWMQGQILLSVIVGILTYLGLLIIGIPYALLLALFTAAAELIPVFGSLIAGAIAAVVAFSTGGFPLAAIVIGLYIVINQFEGNLIYPLIVKKIIGIPPILVIVALVAGYTLFGFLGVVLSVPMAAVVLEFINDFDKHKRRAERA